MDDLLIVADRDLEPAEATLRDCGAALVEMIETEKAIVMFAQASNV